VALKNVLEQRASSVTVELSQWGLKGGRAEKTSNANRSLVRVAIQITTGTNQEDGGEYITGRERKKKTPHTIEKEKHDRSVCNSEEVRKRPLKGAAVIAVCCREGSHNNQISKGNSGERRREVSGTLSEDKKKNNAYALVRRN